ncbi:uncharacterized protein LOC123296366 [Chrysoperla carnea]|uniref:uncharacterized protein LOC123296366 n=1 Tax=Chrysoperla carnea TaxID=189513 RepID=UPI001D077C2E|nr:uncharacterized protein LOC123296366 [Chrysoperla carnea]
MDIFGDISDDIEAEDCSNSMQSSTLKAQLYDSSDDEKNFEGVEIKEMVDDTEETINSVLHENITDGTTEMETHSISRPQELDDESESTDINYQEFCTSLKYDIFDLEAERDQLLNKLEALHALPCHCNA